MRFKRLAFNTFYQLSFLSIFEDLIDTYGPYNAVNKQNQHSLSVRFIFDLQLREIYKQNEKLTNEGKNLQNTKFTRTYERKKQTNKTTATTKLCISTNTHQK